MPEIIEVKIYADFIKKHFNNKKLTNIKIINGRYKKHKPFSGYYSIINKLPIKLTDVNTKGKFMYMQFNDIYIGITLGLSGGWFYQNNGSQKLVHGYESDKFTEEQIKRYIDTAKKHINVEFHFNNGKLLFFDMLSFGTIKIFNQNELNTKLKKLGLDIMDPKTDFDMFKNKMIKIQNKNRYIGNLLMDQKIISGIGNYLRADSLWLSKISPFRKLKDITDKELLILYKNMRSLIWGSYDRLKGIKLNIVSKDDIQPIDYNRDFFVYNNEKDIYNNEVNKEKLYEGTQIRYIYWTPKRQK